MTTSQEEVEIAAKTQIKTEGEDMGNGEVESSSIGPPEKSEPTAETESEGGQPPAADEATESEVKGDEIAEVKRPTPDSDDDEFELDPRKQQWSESLKARLFGSADKDGNFFSYMFLDKIFGETRPCIHCGARGSAKLPPGDNSLQLFVIEQGIIGKQNIMCEKCDGRELVISGNDPSLIPQDPRLAIKGLEIRDYCRKITHYEVLHDLMEMLHIAAMDDGVSRKERHHEVAAFMLHNAKKICEEWCRPEHAELRLRKYLRLREETLLTKYEPTFTPDHTEEYREMYEMMAQSFRQNHSSILILLSLMKESLFDSPSRSNFMMWVSIAMMHSENYPQFKQIYDPRSFMRVESSEYQAMRDRYLSLDVPLGIKKIPIIFVLFEIPRFYHYVDFLNTRLGKRKPRSFLSEEDREDLKAIEEETAKLGMGRAARRRAKKTKTMVSPEAHLDFLTQQEEMDRERVYQSCRDKKAKSNAVDKLGQDHNGSRKNLPKALPSPTPTPALPAPPPKEKNDVGTKGEGGGGEKGEEGGEKEVILTKAQLKRRRKKALAASVAQKEKGEGSSPELEERGAPGEGVALDAIAEDAKIACRDSKSKTVADEQKVEAASEKDKKIKLAETTKKLELADSSPDGTSETSAAPRPFTDSLKAHETLMRETDNADTNKKIDVSVAPRRYEIPEAAIPFDANHVVDVSHAPPELIYAAKVIAQGPRAFPDWEKPHVVWSEIRKTTIALWRAVHENADQLDLSMVNNTGFVKDLCALAYPLIADMLESVNSLAEPICDADMEPGRPKMVSIQVDPFGVYQIGPEVPKTGAIVFVKRKNKVRPLQPAPYCLDKNGKFNRDAVMSKDKSKVMLAQLATLSEMERIGEGNSEVRERIRKQLVELMAQTMIELDDDHKDIILDYNFYSIESTKLPPEIRALVEQGHTRGEELDSLMVNRQEFLDLYRIVHKYGVAHDKIRHHDTESIVCFPSELRMADGSKDKKKATPSSKPSAVSNNGLKKSGAGPGKKSEVGVAKKEEGKSRALKKSLGLEPEATPIHLDEDVETDEDDPMLDFSDIPMPSAALIEKLMEEAEKEDAAKKKQAATKKPPTIVLPPPEKTPPTKRDRNISRRAKREAIKSAKKTMKNPGDHQAIMVTQMDADILRRQGYTVDSTSDMATVVASKEGSIIHILDGQYTPMQVRDFLAKRYSIVSQQAGQGFITLPTKDHPGGLLMDPKMTPQEEPPRDKFSGNRKKLRNKKKAIQEQQYTSVTRPMPRPKNPYSERLGLWATQDGPWPEGLDYGTEYHSDREILCESEDESLVKAIDKDEFGNHSMLMRLELSTVDVPNEKAAETVMNRYMEPADLGPGIDPKVPRYIVPSGGGPTRKLPPGTMASDIPFIMRYAAPHKQMRALDAMKIPYKYELTQLLTPHLNDEGEECPDQPKRRALLSKLTLLPKSRYRSLNPDLQKEKEKEKEEEEEEGETGEEKSSGDPAKDEPPKISKAKRKKMKKKMKQLAIQEGDEGATPTAAALDEPMVTVPDEDTPMFDPSVEEEEEVRSKIDHAPSSVRPLPLSPPVQSNPQGAGEGNAHKPPSSKSKPKFCDNCGKELLTRVQVCAGCKKVAYCNFRCQKASWKVHKKTCSYALRKDGKESTG